MELTLPSDDDEPKDYGQFNIGQTPTPSVEVGCDGASGNWWYRVETTMLARFIKYAKTLVEEAVFYFGQDGFFIRVVDPSHVAMAVIATPGCDRQASSASPECENKWGLELSKLERCLDKTESHITLVLDENANRLLAVNDKCETSIRPLDRQNMQAPRIPIGVTDMTHSFDIDSRDWLKGAKRLNDIGDLVTLSINEASTACFSISGESDSRTYTLSDDTTGEGVCSTQYSLQYILPFAKAIPQTKKGATTFRVRWGDRFPLFLESIEGGNDIVEWEFFLAPRVDGDS